MNLYCKKEIFQVLDGLGGFFLRTNTNFPFQDLLISNLNSSQSAFLHKDIWAIFFLSQSQLRFQKSLRKINGSKPLVEYGAIVISQFSNYPLEKPGFRRQWRNPWPPSNSFCLASIPKMGSKSECWSPQSPKRYEFRKPHQSWRQLKSTDDNPRNWISDIFSLSLIMNVVAEKAFFQISQNSHLNCLHYRFSDCSHPKFNT